MKTRMYTSPSALLAIFVLSILLSGCYPSDVIKAIDDPAFQRELLQYDVNGDGQLSKQEAMSITELFLPQDVKQTEGIKYLENLEEITCRLHEATELDLSKNHKLQKAIIEMPSLRKLKINPEIEYLSIWNSGYLDKLHLSSLPNLKKLYISNLTSEKLLLEDLPNLETLEMVHTNLTSLDISNLPALKELSVEESAELTSLNWGTNSLLENVFFADNPKLSLTAICKQSNLKLLKIVSHDKNNNLDRLEFGLQPNLKHIYIENYEVDLSKTEAPNLEKIEAYGFKSIHFGDLSKFPFLKAITLPWSYRTMLDISKNPHIDDIKGMDQLQEIKAKREQVDRLTSHYQGIGWHFNFQIVD